MAKICSQSAARRNLLMVKLFPEKYSSSCLRHHFSIRSFPKPFLCGVWRSFTTDSRKNKLYLLASMASLEHRVCPSTRSQMVEANFKLFEPSHKDPAQDTHPTTTSLPVKYETLETLILRHPVDWHS